MGAGNFISRPGKVLRSPGYLRKTLKKLTIWFGKQDSLTGYPARSSVSLPRVQGTSSAWHGIVNAQEFGRKLDAVYAGAPVPHKVKIAVAGCPNSCTKPRENDIGFAGMAEPSFTPENCIACKKCLKACKEGAIIFSDDRIAIDAGRCVTCGDCIAVCKKQALTLERSGFAVYIGGKMGRHPVLGMKIAEFADEETATGLLDRTLAFYRREGRPRERLADTLRRSGKKKAIQEILAGRLISFFPAGRGRLPSR